MFKQRYGLVSLLLAPLAEMQKPLQNIIRMGREHHSSVLMDAKPRGCMLDFQGCGKYSDISFKTLMNFYITIRDL